MPLTRQPMSEPVFEAISLELVPGSGEGDLRGMAREALRRAFEEVLQREPEGWRVEPVHETRPEAFDLVPPEVGEDEGALSLQEAWDVTYALQQQPGVADAEPSFSILQDDVENLPEDEIPPEEADEPGLEALAASQPAVGACQAPASVDEALFDWSPTLIAAFSAWNQIPPAGGERFGKGSRVGHPDSGFIRHSELHDPATGETNRVLAHLGFDFVDDDPHPEHEDGDHGLGTASVIMSNTRIVIPAGFVTGVAPEAEIVPIRVAKKRFLIPEPVLLRSGMNRLRKGIYHAVDVAQCHVISISLGWLRNKGVHEAVKYAVRKHVIVIAAAGNLVPFVVWPAAYPEVIAVAGCTSARRKWSGSSSGKEVSVTAPARNVWKAADGQRRVATSDGTSFSAASTAGIAALWLAFHGRQSLIDRYGSEFQLATVFRWVLERACDPPPAQDGGNFGKGIVNACRTLTTPLPELAELRTAPEAHLLERFSESSPSSVATSGFEAVARAFPNVPQPVLRERLATLLGSGPAAELDRRARGVGEELVFQIASSPELRRAILGGVPAAPEGPSLEAMEAIGESRSNLRERFSRRLRRKIGGE